MTLPLKVATARLDEAIEKAGGMAAVARMQQEAPPGVPEVRLRRGDSVRLEPVHWLWQGFLPAGMLTILGGAPGCGKTTIALSLAATVTKGGAWPDGSRFREPGDVLVWSGEDPASVSAARLAAAGADLTRVFFIEATNNGEAYEAFDPSRDIVRLAETAGKLPAPRLLILDPIVSAVAGDSHENAKVRRSLQPVVDLGKSLGCAVLGITHFSKGTAGRDPVERISGSLAFAALARLVLVAAKGQPDEDEEPRSLLVRAKSNIGPDDGGFAYSLSRVEVAPNIEGQRINWLEALHGSARDVLAEAEANSDEEEEASALDDAVHFLQSELRDLAKPASEILREGSKAGHSERTLKRAKAKLRVESRKETTCWMWALPVKDANSANRAKGVVGRRGGTLAGLAKDANGPALGNVGSLGTVGTLADDGEAF